jgi:hypothetical protein
MFTVDQYRAKAIEYSKLLRTANGSNEVREYQRLERSFTELADNAQWMIDNHDKSLHATAHATAPVTSADFPRRTHSGSRAPLFVKPREQYCSELPVIDC